MGKERASAPPLKAMDQIVEDALLLSQARSHLNDLVLALKRGIEALRTEAMPEIRSAIDAAGAAWVALERDVRAHPDLFIRPRSVEAHGIRFGWTTGRLSLLIPDPDKTVRLIREHLPDMAPGLIETKEAPVKAGLAKLQPAQLRRVGVSRQGGDDTVFIRPGDRTLDSLVAALVKAGVADGVAEDDDA